MRHAVFLVGLILGSIAACLAVALPVTAPVVEIWAPDFYPAGLAFEVRAEAVGCTTSRWAWTVPPGCAAVNPSSSARIQIRCSTGGPTFTLKAKAQGASCGGAIGSSSVVVATSAASQVSLPSCDGTQPAGLVTVPPAGIYYRPGLLSTGQLNLLVVGEQRVRAVVQCIEPGVKP